MSHLATEINLFSESIFLSLLCLSMLVNKIPFREANNARYLHLFPVQLINPAHLTFVSIHREIC